MKRIIVALVIISACLFSLQSASAQEMRKQHRIDARKQASFVERRRQNIRQTHREFRNDRIAFRAERRAGHPIIAGAMRHRMRHDRVQLARIHRHHMMNSCPGSHQRCQ